MKLPSRNTTFGLASLLAVGLTVTVLIGRSTAKAPLPDLGTAPVEGTSNASVDSASTVKTNTLRSTAEAIDPPVQATSPAQVASSANGAPIIPGTQSHPSADAPQGKASIAIGERKVMPPNYGGHYQRVALAPRQEVSIQLSWPEDKVSEGVFVHAIQGGTIDGEHGKGFPLDTNRSVRFAFTPTNESGLFQVLVRRGTAEEVLNFWVPSNRPASDPHAL